MSGHVLLLVLPLIPFVALIVFSSHRMSKRYLPQVMNEVGWRGFASVFFGVLVVIALDAAIGKTEFLNEVLIKTFVLVPFVAVVVLPLALIAWRSHWLTKLISAAFTICIAIVVIFVEQYLSIGSFEIALVRLQKLLPAALTYATVLICVTNIAIRIKLKT